MVQIEEYSEEEMQNLKTCNEKLINKIKAYRKDMDLSKIDEAFWFAVKAHKHQRRRSGEPYITHPIAVTNILADLKLDRETLIAGLLHDVVEDTKYTSENIEELFGEEVAFIVAGVTKLLKKQFQYTDAGGKYANNYKNMLLGSSKDPRVILVKIADRLHNMKTLEHMTPEKQKEKATETMNIYAPLALNFGISEWRTELEDLSFKYLHPEEFQKLKNDINKKKEQRAEQIEEVIRELKSYLDFANIKYEIDGRYKHLYSIHRKMQKKDLTIDELYDLSAIRILVEDIQDCYTVLGIVQINYQYLKDRFKDYISNPKPNGYQSLHTAFFYKGEKYEVQIRTHNMHEIAEKGVAAHWKYKGANSGKDEYLTNVIKRQQQIYTEAETAETGTEFVEKLKDELNPYSSKIYCFTPKGAVFSLVENSTPVDFAYMVHSAVGNTMVGARVNGTLVPFEY
ncbi:MAG: RelA/SpoT family protein, partial [Defluviitaleaceae bacterium]|nr:RelA/SpoT family protein [Defluviitaleaceae bacterium]